MVLQAPLWAFFALGTLASFYIVLEIVTFFYIHLRPSSIDRYRHHSESWALVTGASDGIGLGFAQELCQHGFNIILHGRNTGKLEKVKSELTSAFPKTKVRIFIAEVTKDPTASLNNLISDLRALPLTVLVNNVGGTKGFVSTDFKTFSAHTSQEIDALCDANARFTTKLTNALLPTLSQNQPSLILNIGTTGIVGMPYLSVYTASKAYLAAWSFALKAEMQAEGLDIEVHGILSGATQSGQNRKPATFFNPTSRTLAKAALGKVGCGKAVVTAYLPHALQKAMIELLPEWVVRPVLIQMLRPLNHKYLHDY